MTIIVIKSAICLTVLYGFYFFFLRNTKSLVFNRYYLLFSVLFALSIPLVSINNILHFPPGFNISMFFNSPENLNQISGSQGIGVPFLNLKSALVIIYALVSSALFVRFASNIYRMSGMIRKSLKVDFPTAKLVLVSDQVLPYSFLRYIFVNRDDYENGRIEEELLIHEQVHCMQFHSVDILIIEFLKVILWFNPLIWLFSRAIELNHEYLADNQVISGYGLDEYQNTLINIVFRNNSIYLASNFNYSSIKKRLIMMEKKKSDTIVLRILVTIPLFLFLGLFLANAQETSVTKKEQGTQIEMVPPPPPPVSDMKVMKGDDGRLYVIDADGNKKEVSEKDVPPPPPPPPSEKKKVIKGDDGKIYIIEAEGTKKEVSEKDISPPSPPADKKVMKHDASAQSEKALKDQKLKEEQIKKLQMNEQELKDQELKAKQK